MEKINQLRKLINLNHLEGYIVPKNDEFFNENVQVNKDRLKTISNFTGSAGGYENWMVRVDDVPSFSARYIRLQMLARNTGSYYGLSIFEPYHYPSVTNATGSFEGVAITAPTATTSMGAVITYQDAGSGSNTLNTDIVMKLSADNGSNYSTATLTALPDFASGIKMAKVNDLTVTSGTQLKYKFEFANQGASKLARIRGVSLQY